MLSADSTKKLKNQSFLCPICQADAIKMADPNDGSFFIKCPVCGKFQLYEDQEKNKKFNPNHLGAYLIYHKLSDENNGCYITVIDKSSRDDIKDNMGNNSTACSKYIDEQVIENWFPKTFAERVDYVLEFLGKNTVHMGQKVIFRYQEILGALFVDRWNVDSNGEWKWREKSVYGTLECQDETIFMLNFLTKQDYIEYMLGDGEVDDVQSIDEAISVTLLAEGYKRLDEIQKNLSTGKNAFVAMAFGEETENLRECIREGIMKAGYNAVFIDEKEHNNFISPEILKEIRDSKFVVADLSNRNRGAYFEEGYAMGIGKTVIQLCKDETDLHFDVAQKNTIMWKKEEEIPDKLCKRIKATID